MVLRTRIVGAHMSQLLINQYLTRTDAPDPKRAEGTTPAVKLKSDPDNGIVVLDAETAL